MKSPPVVGSAGWLGLLLGSRLYFPIPPEVLADGARYAAAINDIAQEVRRRTPLESAGVGEGEHSVQQGVAAAAAVVAGAALQPSSPRAPSSAPAATALAGRRSPGAVGGGGGGGGVQVLNTHSTVSISTVHNNFTNSGNSGATTIVLM